MKKEDTQLPLGLETVSSDACPSPIEEKVGKYLTLFGALHLSPNKVIEILSDPRRFWRRLVIVNPETEKRRECYVPHHSLRIIQKAIIKYIVRNSFKTIKVEESGWLLATAFKKNASIVRNAWKHANNCSSLVLDLRDAFASIKRKHVYRFLLRSFDKDLAWIFCHLLTYKGRIRQGAPSSPQLFNLLMSRFDKKIAEAVGAPLNIPIICGMGDGTRKKPLFARDVTIPHRSIIYTRYADDLCFSSPTPKFPKGAEKKIRQTVRSLGLHLNKKRALGKNGHLIFPGVQIIHGRIQPAPGILMKWGDALREGNPNVLKGYERFARQFPRRGRQKAYRLALMFADDEIW